MTVLGFSRNWLDAQPDEAPAPYVWCAWFKDADYHRELLPQAALRFLHPEQTA
jgi:hypothetical protein